MLLPVKLPGFSRLDYTRLRMVNSALFTNYYLVPKATTKLSINKEPRVYSSVVEPHIPQSHDTSF